MSSPTLAMSSHAPVDLLVNVLQGPVVQLFVLLTVQCPFMRRYGRYAMLHNLTGADASRYLPVYFRIIRNSQNE